MRRAADEADRRRKVVSATPAGEARFRAGLPDVLAALREALSPLTAEERKVLLGLLGKIGRRRRRGR